jgi:hypothetical protein
MAEADLLVSRARLVATCERDGDLTVPGVEEKLRRHRAAAVRVQGAGR